MEEKEQLDRTSDKEAELDRTGLREILSWFILLLGFVYGPLDPKLGIRDALEKALRRPIPPHVNWFFCLGGITFFLFIIQAVSGTLLMFHYRPTVAEAFGSVQFITNYVAFGWLIRGVHRWGSTLMILTIFLHMLRVLFYGAYRPPRELNWVVGMTLLVVTLAFGFTGYLCHGGNPVSYDHAMDRVTGFIGKPGPKEGVFLCARCHADVRMMRQYGLRTDQFSEYKASIHGKRLLEKGDPNVATCISCHGAHNILKKDSPYSAIYRLNIPRICAKCHSDKNMMKPYKIPTNQMEEYQKSYHGQLLLEEGDFRSPTCADCHGVHGATPPGVAEVANVCGTCHFVIAGYFREGSHERAIRAVGVPKCVSCHGTHYVARAGEELFSGNEKGHCGSCHRENSEAYRLGQEIRGVIYGTMAALERAENGVLELKKKGLDVSDLEAAALVARARIIETKPVSHTLALTKVQALSREALRDIRGIEEESEKLGHQLYIRKKALTIALTLVLVMIALLYIKKKSVD